MDQCHNKPLLVHQLLNPVYLITILCRQTMLIMVLEFHIWDENPTYQVLIQQYTTSCCMYNYRMEQLQSFKRVSKSIFKDSLNFSTLNVSIGIVNIL